MNLIKINKGDCRFCGHDCEGQHGFSDEKGFIDICDDCLNNILAEKELKEELEQENE